MLYGHYPKRNALRQVHLSIVLRAYLDLADPTAQPYGPISSIRSSLWALESLLRAKLNRRDADFLQLFSLAEPVRLGHTPMSRLFLSV